MSLFSRQTYDTMLKVAVTSLIIFSGFAAIDCVFSFTSVLQVRKIRLAKIEETKPEDIVV